jgi:hypothetical protein
METGTPQRWVLFALVPGCVGALIFLSALPVYWFAQSVDAMMSTLWVGLYSALAIPVYLYSLGRQYVREVHAGLKSATSFALLWCMPNLLLWMGGGGLAAFVLFPAR